MAVEKKKSKVAATGTKPPSKPPSKVPSKVPTKVPSKVASATKVSSTKPLQVPGALTPSRLASRQKHRDERDKVRHDAKQCTYDQYGAFKQTCHESGAACSVYAACGHLGVDPKTWPIHPFENLRDNPDKERQIAVAIGKGDEAAGRNMMRDARKCITTTMWNDPTFQTSMRENKDQLCRDDYARWYERQQQQQPPPAAAAGGGKKPKKKTIKKKAPATKKKIAKK
jgi:hypothetical protein